MTESEGTETKQKTPQCNGCVAWFQSEGSVRGWFVVLASFLCNGIIFGILNSVSVVYDSMVLPMKLRGDATASGKASLVGSLAIGMTFFTSAIAGVLTDKLGTRTTALVGSILATLGLFASHFLYHPDSDISPLYFSFGVMFGMGASLVYTPSLVVLGYFFRKKIGVVNGFVTSGSSVFTLAMPHIMNAVINAISLKGLFLVLAFLTSILIGCSYLFFQPETVEPAAKKRRSLGLEKFEAKKLINLSLFSRPRYLIWAVAMPTAFLGYFVFYVHTVSMVKGKLPGSDGTILISVLSGMSLASRLICGPLVDHPKVNILILQPVAFFLLGLLTMLLVACDAFWQMILLAVGMGLCDGVVVTLIGPIAFELCGKECAAQAIGFVLGICSIPMTVGPTIAGIMYDQTSNYTIAYNLSGGLTILGSVIMISMLWVKKSVPDASPAPDAIEIEVIKPLYKETTAPAPAANTRPDPPSYSEVALVKLLSAPSTNESEPT